MASYSDPNRDSLKESVLMNLRSVTQSRQGGVPLSSLDRDYRDLLGNSIPYRELGYQSLESFLRDIPNVIKIRNKNGQLVAEGVADSSTAHIVSLVNRQKAAKIVLKPRRSGKSGISSRSSYGKYNSSKTNSYPKKYSIPTKQINRKHSKFTQNDPKEHVEVKSKVYDSHSPERSKFQPAPQRKYETPPRFLRFQQKKLEKEETQRNDLTQRVPFIEQPELSAKNFNFEHDNNIFIKSPRSLNTKKADFVKKDRLKELEEAITSKEYIEIYADLNNLQYYYSTKPCGQKKKNFISSLFLDGKKYHSYPEFSTTQEGAEEIAATNAVKSIKESQGNIERKVVVLRDNNLQIRIKC